MVKKFLKAKHWQLFLLMLGLPILFEVYFLVNIFKNINLKNQSNPQAFFDFFQYFPFLMILFTAVFFGWIWSISVGMQKFIPDPIKMKITRFKIFFFIPLIYILFISFYMSNIFENISSQNNNLIAHTFKNSLFLIFPLHFFSMFCMFYIMYFSAKTLKTVELQKTATLNDYLGLFLGFWFYIIGIWFIQPKINKILEKNSPSKNSFLIH